MFTCEGCNAEYRPSEASAVARIYVKDSRCNHIEARCTHCGVTEVIYLGPNRIEEVLRDSKVPVAVQAEATARLRVRAENAWAAAEDESERPNGGGQPATVGPPLGDHGGERGSVEVISYELTSRHEELLTTFGEALNNIPDDLLWDGLEGETPGDLPPRWTDGL